MTTQRPENRILEASELDAFVARGTWSIVDDKLFREFRFADFRAAFAFMTMAAFEAEALEHHPDWWNCYSRVEVSLQSHDLGGISELCTTLAARMDALFEAHFRG